MASGGLGAHVGSRGHLPGKARPAPRAPHPRRPPPLHAAPRRPPPAPAASPPPPPPLLPADPCAVRPSADPRGPGSGFPSPQSGRGGGRFVPPPQSGCRPNRRLGRKGKRGLCAQEMGGPTDKIVAAHEKSELVGTQGAEQVAEGGHTPSHARGAGLFLSPALLAQRQCPVPMLESSGAYYA